MSDLCIREADGWEELDEFHTASAEIVEDIWLASGSGDVAKIDTLLYDIGYDFGEDERVVGFRMVAVPDDILGRLNRAWVKLSKP